MTDATVLSHNGEEKEEKDNLHSVHEFHLPCNNALHVPQQEKQLHLQQQVENKTRYGLQC